ncbi:hypothetical protein AAFF_G00386400 [Aldrovandia affinis]|uniref:Thromboxane-A synthase n=1 Tax=Aldrovandia affinis TaxID=143900 RepID=A0AAD7SF05_9TELE|nr:hypothetical protein AAFF_G00386400 [Aldrovandia affinis]
MEQNRIISDAANIKTRIALAWFLLVWIMELTVDLLKPSGLSVSLYLLLFFLALLYWYSIFPYSILRRYGIRHPKPMPFYGNMFLFRKGFLGVHQDLINKYGKVCGYYIGRKPVVVVADPDMLRQILVKEFSSFPNRMPMRTVSKPMSDSLLMLRDERWKRVRSILTPTFSSARMKEMVPLISTATDTLMRNLQSFAQSGESFDIHKCFGCFTMDVIASVAFGTQVDSQNNPDEPFVHHTQKFFSFSLFRPLMLLFIAFPFLAGIIPNKSQRVRNSFFISCIQEIIRQRDEQPASERRRDFLQLMLDVKSSKECVALEHFDVVNQEDERPPQHPSPSSRPNVSEDTPPDRAHKRMMTEDEIVGQAFIFLLAGYETSSSTLAFVCYLLATHPDCQDRLQGEVDAFFSRHCFLEKQRKASWLQEAPDYHSVQELKYLDMVISEALRLYPPGFRFTREVEHNCTVNGQVLPKGATLDIPAGCLHHDPQHWPEPDRFNPERFTAEARASRHPFVYLPFGAGPRGCVGMRLAHLEIKMALVHIFHKFTLITCAETKIPLELKSFSTLGPKNGIFVKIIQRETADLVTPPPPLSPEL